MLPIRGWRAGGWKAGGQAGSARQLTLRRTLLDLLPTDALVLLDTPRTRSRTRSQRAWREAAHHLDVARRLGEDVPEREEILEAPPEVVRAR